MDFKTTFLLRYYPPLTAVIALAILSTYYYGFFGATWAVTGELTRWGGHILQAFGVDLSPYSYYTMQKMSGTPLTRNAGVMLIGMFAGCFIASALSNNIKLRFPASKRRAIQALVGGIISGFGARIAMGCNLANFFTGLPYFSLHTWVFSIFMILGIYVASRVVVMKFLNPPVKLVRRARGYHPPSLTSGRQKLGKERFYFNLGILTLLISLSYVIYLSAENTKLHMALIFGLSFGFLISRGQICFTSAFRDLFLTGRSNMAKAIIIGMCISCLGAYTFISLGHGVKLVWVGPNAIIGGFLFGFGIVLAGGCECGWMYRALEGQVHYWIAGAGNIIGTIILALTWDYYAEPIALRWHKINMLEMFGSKFLGLIFNYLLLLFLLLFVLMYSKRFLRNVKERR